MMGKKPDVISFYSSLCPDAIYTGFVPQKNQRKENYFAFTADV